MQQLQPKFDETIQVRVPSRLLNQIHKLTGGRGLSEFARAALEQEADRRERAARREGRLLSRN
jgi:hypothetical protein